MQSVSRVVLRFTFVARALISLAIALMLANAPPTFIGIGVPFLAFAFADGTLAIVMASLAFNTPELRGRFVALALLDGIVLLVAGALVMGHGLGDSDVLLAPFIGIAATCFSVVGIVHVIVARWLHQRLGRNVLSLALVIASVASAALGVAAVLMPPNAGLAKQLLLVSVLLQGLALLLPAAYSWPSAARVWEDQIQKSAGQRANP